MFYGQNPAVTSVEPDTVPVDGVDVNVVLVCDSTNHRVVRLNEQVYTASSQCVFTAKEFPVPVRLRGYALAGTIPPNLVTVEYKASPTATSWRKLDQVADVPSSTYFLFRLTVRIPMGYPLEISTIQRLMILGEQT
jgi:hypothetical protein